MVSSDIQRAISYAQVSLSGLSHQTKIHDRSLGAVFIGAQISWGLCTEREGHRGGSAQPHQSSAKRARLGMASPAAALSGEFACIHFSTPSYLSRGVGAVALTARTKAPRRAT